jgi:hypothetical protein
MESAITSVNVIAKSVLIRLIANISVLVAVKMVDLLRIQTVRGKIV